VRCDATVLETLVAEYEAGASTVEPQGRFSLSKGSVLSILHDAGVKIRRQPIDEQGLKQIRRLYQSGLTIREVAAELAMPKTTVQEALSRLGSGDAAAGSTTEGLRREVASCKARRCIRIVATQGDKRITCCKLTMAKPTSEAD
jgi:hypothetical protein